MSTFIREAVLYKTHRIKYTKLKVKVNSSDAGEITVCTHFGCHARLRGLVKICACNFWQFGCSDGPSWQRLLSIRPPGTIIECYPIITSHCRYVKPHSATLSRRWGNIRCTARSYDCILAPCYKTHSVFQLNLARHIRLSTNLWQIYIYKKRKHVHAK